MKAQKITITDYTNATHNHTSNVTGGDLDIPSKAAYTDVDTGTDDTKYITPLALRESQTAFETIGFALSDETTALTTGQKIAIYWPFDFMATRVYAEVVTAPTDATLEIDVEVGGTSILNAVLSITTGTYTAETSAFAGATTHYHLYKGNLVTGDIDQVGSTVKGAGAKVFVEGYRQPSTTTTTTTATPTTTTTTTIP
jgi:hypothetical protein